MRAPPDAVKITTGRRSSVARSNRRDTRSPTTVPIDPMRNDESITPSASLRPAMEPDPVRTASSSPVRSRSPSILSR